MAGAQAGPQCPSATGQSIGLVLIRLDGRRVGLVQRDGPACVSPAAMPGGRRLEQVGLAGLILMFLIPFLPSWLFDSGRSNTGRAATSAACAACPGPMDSSARPRPCRRRRGRPEICGVPGPEPPLRGELRPLEPPAELEHHQGRHRQGRLAAGAGRSNALFHRCAAQEVASSTCRRPGEPAGQSRVSSLQRWHRRADHASRSVPTAGQVEIGE
jgi:hypothetical protein